MRRAGIGLLALLLVVGPARAEPSLSPPEPALGERATLRLQPVPADSTQWPVGVGAHVRAGSAVGEWEVIPVRVGRVGVALPAAGDTLWWVVPGSIDRAAPELLRPLWHVGDLGPTWWPTALLLALVLGPLLIMLARRLLRPRAVEAPFRLPEEPAHLVALRRLEELEGRGWIAEGRFEPFYVEASHALRAYIGGRYRVPALDWTSTEVVRRLEAAGYERSGIEQVDPLLRSADEVKFAAHRPTEHQAEQWLSHAREWIHATAVEPVYSSPEAIAAADALNARRRP